MKAVDNEYMACLADRRVSSLPQNLIPLKEEVDRPGPDAGKHAMEGSLPTDRGLSARLMQQYRASCFSHAVSGNKAAYQSICALSATFHPVP